MDTLPAGRFARFSARVFAGFPSYAYFAFTGAETGCWRRPA